MYHQQTKNLLVSCSPPPPDMTVPAQSPAGSWTVNGPGRSALDVELVLDAAGGLHLAVDRDNVPALLPGRLGIRTDQHDLTTGLRLVTMRESTVHESYRTTTGKQLQRSATMREATFTSTARTARDWAWWSGSRTTAAAGRPACASFAACSTRRNRVRPAAPQPAA